MNNMFSFANIKHCILRKRRSTILHYLISTVDQNVHLLRVLWFYPAVTALIRSM